MEQMAETSRPAAAAAAAAAAASVVVRGVEAGSDCKKLRYKIPLAEKAAYYLSIPDSKFAQMCPELGAAERADIVLEAVSDVVSDLTRRTVFEFDEILFRFAVPRTEFRIAGFHRRLVASVRNDWRYQTHRAVTMMAVTGATSPFFLDCVYTIGDEQLCVSARPMYSMDVVTAFVSSLGRKLTSAEKDAWITKVEVRRDTMFSYLLDGKCTSNQHTADVFYNSVSVADALALQQFTYFTQLELYPADEVKHGKTSVLASASASAVTKLKIPGPSVKVPTRTGVMLLRKVKTDVKDIAPPIVMCDD